MPGSLSFRNPFSGCGVSAIEIAQLNAQIVAIRASLARIEIALSTVQTQGVKILANNDQFLADEAQLKTAVQANTAAIANLGTLVSADTASIASLTQQIAVLQASNPGIDLTGLEQDIAALAANNTAAATILTPAPVAPVIP